MLVEHEFISTLNLPDFDRRATELLVSLGFTREATAEEPKCQACGYSLKGIKAGRCPECGAADTSFHRIEYSRGGKGKGYVYEVVPTHAQRVFLVLDRGKTTVAASIDTSRHGVNSKPHAELLTALASTLEATLGLRAASDAAAASFREVEERIARKGRRARKAKIIVLVSVLTLIFGLIATAIIVSK